MLNIIIIDIIIILLDFQTGEAQADYLPYPQRSGLTSDLWPLWTCHLQISYCAPSSLLESPPSSEHRLALLYPQSFIHHHAKHESFTPTHGTD